MRLTNCWRNTVIHKALDETFLEKEKIIMQKEREIGDEVYQELFKKETLEIINKIPNGWLPKRMATYVNLSGFRMEINFSEPKSFPDRWPFFYHYQTQENITTFTNNVAREDLKIKLLDILKEKEALKQKKSTLRNNLRALLYSVTTDKKLMQIWPEGKKYFTLDTKDIVQYLPPAIKIDEINEMLGLKKEKDNV